MPMAAQQTKTSATDVGKTWANPLRKTTGSDVGNPARA